MSNQKNKIKEGLHEISMNEKVITPDELKKNTDALVKTAKDALGIDDIQAKDYVSGFIGEEGGVSDLSQVNANLISAKEDWQMHLADTVGRSLKSFSLPEVLVDAILAKMQNSYWSAYDEVRRKLGGNWDNLGEGELNEFNKDVMQNFIDQYGEEKGKQYYYATANKQGRDPENFHTEGTGEDFGDIGSQDLEVGADKYEEYRQLMQQMAADEEGEERVEESKKPTMTKDKLEETVTGKKQRKVIKTVKVKDIK